MTHEEAVGYLQETGWLQDHDKQIYEQGKNDGIEWHPYPKEKPTEDGRYLVTIRMFCRDGFDEEYERRFVQEDVFDLGYFWKAGVIAWAELPKPYKEGADNDD